QTESVEHKKMEIIFGRDFKLEAAAPYLFYACELRRYCPLAKLIVAVGYSFSDAHINKMLVQALRNDDGCRLLVSIKCELKKDIESRRDEIAGKLQLSTDRIVPQYGSAKEFLERSDLGSLIRSQISDPADKPF